MFVVVYKNSTIAELFKVVSNIFTNVNENQLFFKNEETNEKFAIPKTDFFTVKDLIAKVKAKPDGFNYASAGTGSATHINSEKFRVAAGIIATHIPFKGTPEALTETISGRIDWFFAPIVSALPLIKDGKLQVLAVGTPKRLAV